MTYQSVPFVTEWYIVDICHTNMYTHANILTTIVKVSQFNFFWKYEIA